MLKGKIILNKKTGNLCIDGKLPEQNFVKIRTSDIEKFDLEEGNIVEYTGIPYSTVTIVNKVFELQVKFEFDGKVFVNSDSKENAEKICNDSFGLVAGGTFHESDSRIVNWDFDTHPEKLIFYKNEN